MIGVAFLPASIDACALYRMYIPHLNRPGSRFLFRMGALDTKELEGCKVAVVQRQVSEQNWMAMHRMRELGLKVVYDLDDNVWALPAANPGKQVFDSLGEGFYKCAKEADMLTVSTRGLATAVKTGFKQLGADVHVVPNSIDLNLFEKKNLNRDDDTVIIGWGGSNTHSDDCREAFNTIPELMDKYPNIRVEVAGAPPDERIVKWENAFDKQGRPVKRKTEMLSPTKLGKHDQTKFRPWVPISEYPNRFASWGWDISLAPLEDNRFNRSKSCIKMLEAAALKIPCVASDVQPYNEFAALGGPDLKWLLCNRTSDWVTKLEVLVNEPERREALGQKMYETATKFFNASTICQNWLYAFKSIV